jgi:catechol 2,3-dioxygenase-like lactoylglutathione lyase family enzyme
MENEAQVIPTLPSRSLLATIAFYERLGFEGELIGDGYAIVTFGPIELHFFPHPELKPEECYSGCYVRVEDVDRLHAQWLAANLPGKGIPRIEHVEDKPWGMREFALLDADGNLLKFGKVL